MCIRDRLSIVKGPNMVGEIMQGALDRARKKAEDSRLNTYEKACKDSQSAYDARDVYKRQGSILSTMRATWTR